MQTPYDYRQTADRHFRSACADVDEATKAATSAEDIETARADADLHIRLAHLALALAEATATHLRRSAE